MRRLAPSIEASLFAAALVAMCTSSSTATVTNLGTIPWVFDFETTASFGDPTQQAVRFELSYPPPLGQETQYFGGDQPRFVTGQTGSVDLSPANEGVYYTDFVSRLTNGSNEYIFVNAHVSALERLTE
jgi:hypothetical protein